MKAIKADLPAEHNTIELHLFADEHIGDCSSDIARLKERIAYVLATPNAYCVMNGDIIDNATRSSIGDIESRSMNIMEQLELATELFGELAKQGKILAITNGNHENRTYRKEGFDISKAISMQLGLQDRYSPTSIYLFLRWGEGSNHGRGRKEKALATVYMLHGSGGGRKEGAKAIRLADMASIVDADVYIHSHTHLPMIMKQGYFRPNFISSACSHVTKLFVNTAANLQYGGYGEAQEFKPSSTDTPVIYFSVDGRKKTITAKL